MEDKYRRGYRRRLALAVFVFDDDWQRREGERRGRAG
jgi:hypothetical protein